MKKLYLYILILTVSIQGLEAQTLEWSHIFETHSSGLGAGINPNSLIDSKGKITTTVIENDTFKVYQFNADGTIANTYNSNKVPKDEYTPIIKTGQNEQALVFESYTQSGSFWFLQFDSVLTVTREFQFNFPSEVTFPQIQNLIYFDSNLYISLISLPVHYIFRINDDNSLSKVYSGDISIGDGADYILLDNGNVVLSYKNSYNHIIRCVSLENETLVWEQSINRNHGTPLKYKMVKNENILYTAGLERAWVDGIAKDELAVSHIDLATGNILFQAPVDLSHCSGCFVGFEDFAYNPINNHIYITYVSEFPEFGVSLVEISNLSVDIITQVYFPLEYDIILPLIDNYSSIHIQPNGQIVLLYKSYKNSTEKSNLYIAPLDSDLESIGTLEINFELFESAEHPTHVLVYDDAKILITGIIPNSNPNIFWEEVEYFVAMIDLDGILSVENPAEDYEQVILYPNPAEKRVNFIIPDELSELTIFDISGKKIHNEKITRQIFDLDISAYQTGVYFVSLTGNLKSYTKKLIVR